MILLNKEMPPNCAKCEFQKTCNVYLTAWADAKDRYSFGQYERIKDCPIREYNPIKELQEIRQEIEKIVVDVLYHDGPDETTVSTLTPEEVFGIIDRHIEQYKENAG